MSLYRKLQFGSLRDSPYALYWREAEQHYILMSVSLSGIGVTRPNLHFFQYIQAYKPFADHVPPNIKQYQLILTKYQPVSSYTDPVPSSTTYNSSSCKPQFSHLNNFSFYDSFEESRTVYLVQLNHEVPNSSFQQFNHEILLIYKIGSMNHHRQRQYKM